MHRITMPSDRAATPDHLMPMWLNCRVFERIPFAKIARGPILKSRHT
jgi:hypothetical protein